MKIVGPGVWWVLASATIATARVELHVAPHGTDGGDGTAARPLATLAGARDLIRERRVDDEPFRVIMHGGVYRLAGSVTFTAEDSGVAGAPIVYAAAEGETVRLVGGVRLPAGAWAPAAEAEERAAGIRVIDLGAVGVTALGAIGPRGFPQPVQPAPIELFFGGEPMTLARYPNDGFVSTGEVIEAGGDAPRRRPVFTFDDERLLRWADAEEVWLFGYWKWDWADESIRVAEIDPDTRQITLASPHRYGVHAGQPFYAENLLEELDAPGEYHVDRTSGQLSFWPPGPVESAECFVSTLAEPMFRFDGASHLRLEGVTLEYARGDAIEIEDGANVTIAGCVLRNLGNRAVVVRGGAGHAVERCDIERTGEGGVALEGGDRRTLTPCGHRVSDCRIRDFSRRTATYRPAVRLAGVGCRVEHCEISDAPHAAILFGGNDHVIEQNDIHHVLGRTGDGGAVYCGRDWTIRGTVIRGNHFHDLAGIRKWESAVYVDDQASGITISENLFTDCHWGMLMGGGRDNVIEGNVFVDCGLTLHFDARGLGWAQRMEATLTERLDAVPYRAAPWNDRFPQLLTLLDDDPMVPKGNVIRGNRLIRSGRIDQDMAEPVKAHGIVEDNVATEDDDPAAARWRRVGPRHPPARR